MPVGRLLSRGASFVGRGHRGDGREGDAAAMGVAVAPNADVPPPSSPAGALATVDPSLVVVSPNGTPEPPDPVVPARRQRFNSLLSVDSVPTGSSVGSVTPCSSDSYTDVGSTQRGAPGLGDPTPDPRRARRKTRARGHTVHRGLRGPRKVIFAGKVKELPDGRLAFFTEIFKLKDTIVLKVVPQIVLAALVGLLANVVKIAHCGDGVESNEECDVTFNLDGHLGVSVVLSFLLVFRADLAWNRYEQGKAALGAIHGGIRNLNVACATFLRTHPRLSAASGSSTPTPAPISSFDRGDAAKDALDAARLARDRMEIFRLTNLLYAFVRHAVRGQRHGYSDVGPVTDDELMTRDRGGKPRVPDIVKDKAESEEFRALEPWNRPNVAVAKITSIIEHHRRVGNLGERAALDAFRDCQTVLDALKSAERIVTTPIPYQYLHMLNILLFFFVYSVPFVFTANFKWVTPFPSAVVALAFYGVNEIGRCMEDPFSWDEPCHDLSGAGWRIYRENLQIHEKADEAHAEDRERFEGTRTKTRTRTPTDQDSNPRAKDPADDRVHPAAKDRRLSKGARVSAADLFRRAVVAAPLAGAASHADAVEEACALEDLAVAAGEAPRAALADGTDKSPHAQAPHPRFFASRRRASSAASVSGPSGAGVGVGGSLGSLAAVARRPSIVNARDDRRASAAGGSNEEDDEDDAMLADPGMLPKELSGHWSGFVTEIFVFRHTVMPTLLPQIIVAFALGVLAQMLKVRACGADVVAAAECQTTFDITGHQVVSVSLGFLLVFRTDWAYDRYYEGKQSLGHLYSGLRNLNVCFVTYLRENRPGEKAQFEAMAERGVAGLGAGTFADSPTRAPRESFRVAAEKIREDRTELLRLTNVLYATMRHILRDLRVGGPNGEDVSDEDCVTKDATGKPPLPDMLREGESKTLLALMPSNRCNWVAMRVQMIVETHRRLGNISERAAFEIYQQLEACLSAYKAMERIVSTPIPFTYLHMLQFILFFFVFSAPFVFTTTFHWIGFVPSVIVAIGFYGINEMGKLIQDPFDWRQPCHDLSGLGLRMYRENLKIHENAAERAERDAKSAGDAASKRAGDGFFGVLKMVLERQDTAKVETDDSVSTGNGSHSLRRSLSRSLSRSGASSPHSSSRLSSRSRSVFGGEGEPSVTNADGASESYGEELDSGPLTFLTILFRYRGTVLPKIAPQVILAAGMSVWAQVVKIYWCGADITSHSQCPLAFSETAHSVAGGIIGFMLVFRTSISYYRFYEGKKYLGHLYDAIRNANIAFCSFMRSSESDGGAERFDRALNADRVELRRLSSVLYAFIRQSVREHRHGYKPGCHAPATDASLVEEDVFGRPSLGTLLTDAEKAEFRAIDPNNRANMVVWRMQSIVEHHRRLGNISERGAFDIYHDLEGCLEAYKHMERIVSTKMPFQYLHMVNFLLFIFVFSAPFVFTTGFKWLSPVPSSIVAIAFYGVAEVARSIEDPYSWIKPCHDLTGVGWRLYSETLQLHESSVADADAAIARRRRRRRAKRVLEHAFDGEDTSDSDEEDETRRAAVVRVTIAAEDADAKKPHSDGTTTTATATTIRSSVAHGPADRALLSPDRPTEAEAIDAALRRAAAAAEAETEIASKSDGVESRVRFRVESRVKTTAYVGPITAEELSRAKESRDTQPTLSTSWYGFFTDVFRVRNTIHAEVFAQVALAFVIGWAAQLAKLWRCGGEVQEAFECPVTFEPYAHSVVGSVLAFMIVYRFKFAYDRYYEAKTAIGELHCGLRNFNIGACAFLRDAREGEPGHDPDDVEGARRRASLLLRERTELLRLSGLLFGFLRQLLREQRLGYPNDRRPGDGQLLAQDARGSPSLGSLLRDADELAAYSRVPFQNRPNAVVTRMQTIVEHHRRLGHVCERGAFDLYRECERVLAALKSCERVVATPIPFQYIQMSNFVTFFFVYSAPFIFTVSYQYISFFPSCLLAMAFYGINCVGEVIERPFDWREPNHDLTGIGLRVWRECVQIHRRCAEKDTAALERSGDASGASSATDALDALARRAASPPDRARLLGPDGELLGTLRARRKSAADMAKRLSLSEYPRHTFSFLTGLFSGSSNALRRTLPQVVSAGMVGAAANYAKIVMCGADVQRSSECSVTFHTEAHAICGAIIGFLLVFCANIAYLKFYEAKTAVGDIYHGLRNMNIAFAAFLRTPARGEPGFGTPDAAAAAARVRADQLELRRHTNVLFAFMRQSLREQRHGYSRDPKKRRGGGIGAEGTGSGFRGGAGGAFRFGGWWKSGGGGARTSDEELLSDDLCGDPSLSSLLTDEDRARYAAVDPANRFNVVVADIQRVVERNRRSGHLYEKAAYDVYRDCDLVLAAFKTCERIVTTPIPYQYTHMVNLVLFCFVFSAPLIFTVTFKWLTPFPSAILALGFYGIWEVGKTMMDPFDWNSPTVDLTEVGKRVATEAQRIVEAGQHRYSTFAAEKDAPRAA